jgi:hypothetical protein
MNYSRGAKMDRSSDTQKTEDNYWHDYDIHKMIYNIQSNTTKSFIVNVNQKGNMFRRFLDRHHQVF